MPQNKNHRLQGQELAIIGHVKRPQRTSLTPRLHSRHIDDHQPYKSLYLRTVI